MKIAICQTNMYWTIQENIESINEWIVRAAKKEVELAIFPECSMTGYHKMLGKIVNKKSIKEGVEQLKKIASANNIAIIIGTPFYGESKNEIKNSVLLIQPNKTDVQINSKIGLTESEKRFFTKSQKRSYLQLENQKIGVIFCREMLDINELLVDFKDLQLDFIIWPSYIKWDDFESQAIKAIGDNYMKNAIEISNQLGLSIYNVNSANTLNDEAISGMGLSKIIENGVVLDSAKKDAEDFKVITIT